MVQIALRALAFVWLLLVTALIGNVQASNVNGRQSAINYAMFTAAWCWVTLIVGLGAAFVSALAIPILLLVLDGLACIFTFVAAIVLAAKLGVPDCGSINFSDHSSGWIAYGSPGHTEKRCREIQASTAFLWFLWATITASLIFTALDAKGSFGGFGGRRGRSTQPAMRQV